MNRISRELLKIAREINALDNEEQEKLDIAQNQGKKYILHHKEGNLWRIQACKNFSNVKKGDFGGLIESENNLSHEGSCWVYDDACVSDTAWIYGNAKVYGDASVYRQVKIYDNAQVYGRAQVCDAWIYGNAKVYGDAQVMTGVYNRIIQIYDNAQVYGDATISGFAKIHGNAMIDYDVRDQEITE